MTPGVALIFITQLYGPPLQGLGYGPPSFESTTRRTNELLGWPSEFVRVTVACTTGLLTLGSLTCSDPDVTQPVPPLVVSHDDHEYVLATNASVRQSAESLSSVPHKDITVTSESMLDLESGYSTAVCAVRPFYLG
jgi:hypothetical protein